MNKEIIKNLSSSTSHKKTPSFREFVLTIIYTLTTLSLKIKILTISFISTKLFIKPKNDGIIYKSIILILLAHFSEDNNHKYLKQCLVGKICIKFVLYL